MRLALMLAAHGFHFVESTGPYPALFQNETTNIAASVANGYGYQSPFVSVLGGNPGFGPSSWIAPVYPYFCAAVFKLFGVFSRPSFFIIVLIQCVISALTCIPILRVGELTVGRRASVIAALTWAIFPWFSQWAITYIWEISLSALLSVCLIWYALTLERENSLRRWCGFGALWGFALLVNPALLTILAASLVWVATRRSQAGRAWLKPAVLSLVMCLVVVSPWLIRNRVVFGESAFIRTNFWFEFWLANYHGGTGRDWSGRHPTTNLAERDEYRRLGELTYVHSKAEEAKEFVREYPGEFVKLTLKRILMFWDGSTIKYNFPAAPYWLPWSFPIFSLLFIASLLFACVQHVHGWGLFLGAALLYPAPYYIAFNQARYRHALEPLMLLVIAWAANEVITSFRRKRKTAASSTAASS